MKLNLTTLLLLSLLLISCEHQNPTEGEPKYDMKFGGFINEHYELANGKYIFKYEDGTIKSETIYEDGQNTLLKHYYPMGICNATKREIPLCGFTSKMDKSKMSGAG